MGAGALRVGTAAWDIPRTSRAHFPGAGSLLERYAARFDCVEINSTFYKLPRRATIERWRDTVPPGFRFAVKVPRTITHEAALRGVRSELFAFVDLVQAFGNKLGPLLVQLPGSLELEPRVCGAFLRELRARHDGAIVFEPRHASFFSDRATDLLLRHRIVRVAADPPRCPGADTPAGDPSLVYYRLHGSPRLYYDVYERAFIDALAARMVATARTGTDVWCIFDNTALGGATHDALELQRRLRTC